MDRFQSLLAFTKVVEAGSFAGAAERLDRSVSAVSRQIAELEAHLGARLLNRTTRKLSLTEAGRAFHERVVQLMAELDDAENAITAHAVVPHGTLKVTASISFGTCYLAPAIAEFQRRHPQLRFDVELSDHRRDLVDEGLDLANHACLTYAYAAEGNVWRFRDAQQRMHEVKVGGSMRANNGGMLAALAVAGAGITLEPDISVAEDVRAGRLVPLLAGYTSPPIAISATYPSRRHLSVKVRAFVDFLVERFTHEPPWHVDATGAVRTVAKATPPQKRPR